eukprot:247001_1
MGCCLTFRENNNSNHDEYHELEALSSSSETTLKHELVEIEKMFIICQSWIQLFKMYGFVEFLIDKIIEYAYVPSLFDSSVNTNAYSYLFKLLIVGDEAVGKSSILLRFTDNRFSNDYTPTIGVEFGAGTVNIQNKLIMLQIWDTAGKKIFRSITTSYYRDTHGIMIVFDITNKESFDNIKYIWKDILNKHSKECVKILIGAKCDLSKERKVSIEAGKKLSRFIGCIEYVEVSAKIDTNTKYCVRTLVETINDFANFKFDPSKPWMYPCE